MIDFLKQITIFFYKIFPRPYGIGYNQYKIRIIKKILNNKEINLVRYIDERIVEIPWIMQNLKNLSLARCKEGSINQLILCYNNIGVL